MTVLSRPVLLLGALSIIAAFWFGLPMTGIPELASPWVRIGCIVISLGSVVVAAAQRARWRRRAAEALEATLIGDGAVLAERMQSALSKLKQTESATPLYDLPWYVMIGPPGAGKTTALVHSGLNFPGTDAAAVAGFGGTRNCDFWFSDEAVLIDTAGRYTTQDSHAQADKASWFAFLQELKGARSHQPINGVIVSLSCEDIMNAAAESLESHAQAVRDRLRELHDALRINVPVYVLFTKADLISGFRSFFGSYGAARRKSVWGVTFQTKDRAQETWRAVPAEFDQLVARLSDEVTDRMNREPDTAARISIFGFPGQMGLMRRNVSEFLRRVFEERQNIGAILRGFYFTSGTQEGTPIDQVLGAMAGAQGAIQPVFLSGRGRSFFLHDLFKRVIFSERHWVGYDNRTLRWRSLVRATFIGLISAVTVAILVTFGYSFWQNATLVRFAQAGAQTYRETAQPLLQQTVITEPGTRVILPVLAAARDIPTGYANPLRQPIFERLGLSRRDSLRRAALGTYSDALEQFLRPRMMLLLENTLPQFLAAGDTEAAFRALKVYLLLAKEQDGRGDDLAIQSYFAEAWGPEYSAAGLDDAYRELNEHLAAMLALDGRVDPMIKPDGALVERTRKAVATLSPAQQVYGAIVSDAATLQPFRLANALGNTDGVFRTADDRPLQSLTVPGLFTPAGYWGFFREAVARSADIFEGERWVLGPAQPFPEAPGLAALDRDLNRLYRTDYAATWNRMLDRIHVLPEAGQAQLATMIAAVNGETRLTGFLDTLEATPEVLLRTVDGAENQQQSLLRQAAAKLLSQKGDGAEFDTALRRQAEETEQALISWHQMQQGGEETLARLAARVSSGPTSLTALVYQINMEMLDAAAAPLVAAYNAALAADVSPVCAQYVANTFPFVSNNTSLMPLSEFGEIFGNGGRLQRLFATHLHVHTETNDAGMIVPRTTSVLASRMIPTLLRSFQQAERIRTVYFSDGNSTPSVRFSITQTSASQDVTDSIVTFGSHAVHLSDPTGAAEVIWPGDAATITVRLTPDTGEDLRFERTGWAILDFVAGGRADSDNAGIDVTHQVGDREVTFRLGFSGPEIPFMMQDFVDFSCPTGIE